MISMEVFFFFSFFFFFFFNAIDVLVTGVVWFSNSNNLRGFVGTISLNYTYFSGFWAVFSSSIETNSHKSCTIDHTLSEETLRIKIFFNLFHNSSIGNHCQELNDTNELDFCSKQKNNCGQRSCYDSLDQ